MFLYDEGACCYVATGSFIKRSLTYCLHVIVPIAAGDLLHTAANGLPAAVGKVLQTANAMFRNIYLFYFAVQKNFM
jgi:hypothetical protein